MPPVFLDLYDSGRFHQNRYTPAFAQLEALLHITAGNTIRISGPQAFDSKTFFTHACDSSFIELIKKGHIEISCMGGKSPLHTFAFSKPTFAFSLWPELKKDTEDRKYILELAQNMQIWKKIPLLKIKRSKRK